jgi:hypothetical protein
MMGRSLLVVGAFSTLGLIATAVVAYMGQPMAIHLMLGLGSSLLLLFSHCWIMFYLIGTGKAIKETVAEHSLDASLVERTKSFKMRSNGWMMIAMGLCMATFILGGGVYNNSLPKWIHHTLFWLTLLAQVKTLWIEHQVLTENEALMAGINRRVAV